jgi:anaerobic dimethyl sulfoxide reductase subunit A
LNRLPVSCNKDCGAGCPLIAHIEGDRIVKITNNPYANRYMTGCVRGYQMVRAVYAEDRLKQPLVRTGPRGSGEFKDATWKETLDLIAERLGETAQKHEYDSILPLGGSGSCRGALHNTALLKERFFSLFGGYTETTGNYSEQAVAFTCDLLFGHDHTGLDPATLQYSNLIILWGANIVDDRFGCEMETRIREQKKRGVPIIVVDPRRSRTVSRLGTCWIPVRPGTDSVLMAAVLNVLIKQNLIDRNAVKKLSIGFDNLESYILGRDGEQEKTPEWASGICGTPTETIVQFARQYGQIKPASLIPGLSIQRTIGGEEAVRMAVSLQVATGNLGIMGGSTGGSVLNKLPQPVCPTIKTASPKSSASVPVYHWPDTVLEGRNGGYPGDIRVIYNIGGNYLSQGSDIGKNIRAFQKVDFSVCHEYFLTPTARYCDVVLPVTTFLEREDIVFPLSNHLFYSYKVIDPLEGAKNDYDIFCELADRLGFGKQFSQNRTAAQWIDDFLDGSEVQDIEEFKRTGIYTGTEQQRVGLSHFVSDPKNAPLETPSGRIEIYSEKFAQTGFSPIPECRILQTVAKYPLRLITPHARFRIHSQNDNIPWFKEREDETLWLHPLDAEKRRIVEGQWILVQSERGSMRIRARVTEDIMPGVVCALEGVWPTFGDDGVEYAGSVNVLTPTDPTLPSQGSRTHSVLVDVYPL